MESSSGRSGYLPGKVAGRWPRAQGVLVKYTPVLILCAAWETLSRSGVINETFLPSFTQVAEAWVGLFLSGELIVHGASSLWREATGFSLAVLFGVSVGIGMARYRPFKDFFEPLISIIFPLPKSALIPILIIWLGIGHLSKVAVIFLGCLLPITISSYNGARGTDKYLIWSAQNMGTGRRKLFWKIIFPAALPDILSGTRLALAVSFVLLVSSEMLAGNSGLGFLLFFLGEGGEYAGMFAAILTLTLLGFSADRLYLFIMRRVLAWHYAQAE